MMTMLLGLLDRFRRPRPAPDTTDVGHGPEGDDGLPEPLSRPYSSVPEMIRDTCDPAFADEFDEMIRANRGQDGDGPDRAEALYRRLSASSPGLVVSICRRPQDDCSIAVHPPRSGFPQVNIRFHPDRVEWQGYWGEIRWGSPIGHAIGLPGMNYVLPGKWGRATRAKRFPAGDPGTADRLARMTAGWFRAYPDAGYLPPPPVPAGYRLATDEEILASEDGD